MYHSVEGVGFSVRYRTASYVTEPPGWVPRKLQTQTKRINIAKSALMSSISTSIAP